MTTYHRAEAEAHRETCPFDAEAHLLAAIHDEQRVQTALLRALVERLPTKGDPCPCGCRRDVEPKPEPESVTVTLPREAVERASRSLRDAAGLGRGLGYPLTAAGFSRAADALDTATGSQS